MSIKNLIKEAVENNPVRFGEELKEELRRRVAVVLEAKMKGVDEQCDDTDHEEDEE